MQVSWIDEDELRALALRLQDAFPEHKPAEPVAPTLNDLSETLIASLLEAGPLPTSQGVVPAPASIPAAPVPVAAPAPAPTASTPPLATAPHAEVHISVITPAPDPVGTMADDENLPEVAQIRDRLKAIRDRAQAAGLLPPAPEVPPVPAAVEPAPAPAPAPLWAPAAEGRATPDFPSLAQAVASITEPDPGPGTLNLPEDGTMAERLECFTHWATRLTRAEQIILMDDYGDLLWGNPETNDLILTAMLALNASSRSKIPGEPCFLRSQLGQGRELHALASATRFGTVTLALINPAEANASTTALLQNGLVRSIEGSVEPAHG